MINREDEDDSVSDSSDDEGVDESISSIMRTRTRGESILWKSTNTQLSTGFFLSLATHNLSSE